MKKNKNNYLRILSLILMMGVSVSMIISFIHSCGSGYYLDPRTVVTATPTPAPPGTELEYEPFAISWSAGIDFSQGEFEDVEPTDSGNGLQLGVGGEEDFRPTTVCIAVHQEDRVYIHDIDEPANAALTKIVDLPKFGSESVIRPSRTAIDRDENCWVGGGIWTSGNGGVYKIDKEGNVRGKIQLPDDHIAHSLAIDKNGFVWVGTGGDSVDNDGVARMYKISPGEDINGNLIILDSFPVISLAGDSTDTDCTDASPDGLKDATTYGAAVDSLGNLYVIGKLDGSISSGFISKIDTASGEMLDKFCGTSLYGIVIDDNDNPWIGSISRHITKFNKDDLSDRIIIDLRPFTADPDDTSIATRGLGKDTEGYIWVADSSSNLVYKFDPGVNKGEMEVGNDYCAQEEEVNGYNCGYLGKVNTGGSKPVGVSGDLYGNVWAVNQGGNPSKITKIIDRDIDPDPAVNNSDKRETYDTGTGTYSYSDFVGFGLFSTVLRNSGFWRVKFDSGYDEPHWTGVSWSAKVNDSTQVSVRVRSAASEEEIETASYTQLFDVSPADLGGLVPDLRWIQIEVYFYTLDQTYTPILDDLSLNFELPEN